MSNVEAAETNLGKFVPMHLLKFDNDLQLQFSFRRLIETEYEKGVVKSDTGICQKCSCPLSVNGNMQMKPSKRRTQKITKLLEKHRSGSLFGNYNNFLLERYMKSCTQLVVRCTRCQHRNRQPLVSNEAKQSIKEKLLQEALHTPTPEVNKLTPSQKKKKRKRKKNKSDNQDHCGLKIPAELRPTSDLQQEQMTSQISPTKTPSLKKSSTSPQTSQNDIIKNKRVDKSTPLNSHAAQTPLSAKRRANVNRENSTKKSGMKQKGIKQFLEQDQQETKKTSLSDFLSSL